MMSVEPGLEANAAGVSLHDSSDDPSLFERIQCIADGRIASTKKSSKLCGVRFLQKVDRKQNPGAEPGSKYAEAA